jgi:myo-inositol catabolism protein IolC
MTSSTKSSNPVLFVALDDRVDFFSDILDISGDPAAADREQAANLKRVVFDGITTAIERGIAKSNVALWADSDLGESVLLRAKAMSLTTASSPGSGAHSLGKLNVDYTAVQLNFNPDGLEDARKELLVRLKIVSDKARVESVPLMIELDATPGATQIEMYGSFADARSMMLLTAIQQLQDAGVDPAIWAIEPPSDDVFTAAIAAQARLDDRSSKLLLVVAGELGSGQVGSDMRDSEKRVIRVAARTHGVAGVLIGPGAYYRHLVQFHEGIIEREKAVDVIADHLVDVSEIFENSRTASEVL